MQIYKNITISKINDDASTDPKKPSHNLTVSDKDYQNKINVGRLWTKESQYGKFLSGKMSDFYQGKEKAFDGYVIVSEQELEKVLKLAEAMEQKLRSPLGDAYPTDVEEFPEPSDFDF